MKMMLVAVVVGLMWAGGMAGLGQGGAKADSSASLRNDKQSALRDDKQKRPMTFSDLMAMKRVSDPQISASGRWVLFSVTDVSLEKNSKVNHLWVVALDPTHDGKTVMNGAPGGSGTNAGILPSGQNENQKTKDDRQSAERQVTFGDGESNGRFSADGKWVSISMNDQIYLASWNEAAGTVGKAVQLTHVSGGADGGIWSPDSKRLMFVAGVYPGCSVKGGARTETKATTEILTGGQNDDRRGGSAQNEVRGGGMAVLAGAEASTWAEEDACDKARDEAAEKSPVKAQVWDALLYRHWDHYLGTKRSHVLVVSATDGGMVRDLTPAGVVGDAETPTFSLGGPLGYAWAPDSKEIAYVTNLDKVPAASTNNDVFTLRLDEAGAKAVKVSTSPGSDDGPAYSPDGKWLAFRSQARNGFESDRFRLMLFDRGKKTIKEVMPKFDRWVDEFTWAPDSKEIYFASGMAGEEAILVFGLNDSTVRIFTPFGGEFGDLRVTPNGGYVLATKMRVLAPTEIVQLHPDWKQSEKDDLVATVGMPDGIAPGAKFARNSFPSLYAKEVQLSHLNSGLTARLALDEAEPFWFEGAEGVKVQGFLIKPPGFDPAKKYPVKFLMHGGPQTAWGDAWSYRWNWQLMAANGYVVVGINRRGSTGYGQKFVDEVSGDWGGRAYVDLMKGLDYAEGHYPFLDKTRECALGASYGGFMADWVLTHTNRFKCIVTHDGLYDPASAYGDTEEMWFNEWEFRRAADFPKGWDGFLPQQSKIAGDPGFPPQQSKIAGDPGFADPTHAQTARVNGAPTVEGRAAMPWRYAALPEDQDPFRKWSPMLHIQDAKTPTLVIHSQKDYRLDVSQGIALFTALQRLGVPSKMLYFPDEGHWVLKPQNSQMWNEVVSDWCDRWTKTGKYVEK